VRTPYLVFTTLVLRQSRFEVRPHYARTAFYFHHVLTTFVLSMFDHVTKTALRLYQVCTASITFELRSPSHAGTTSIALLLRQKPGPNHVSTTFYAFVLRVAILSERGEDIVRTWPSVMGLFNSRPSKARSIQFT